MTKITDKKTADIPKQPNSPQPNRWSFLRGSQEILERQKSEPTQEEEVRSVDQSDNLSEVDPDIKESIATAKSP